MGPWQRDRLYTLEREDIMRKSYASISKKQEDESKIMENLEFHQAVAEAPKQLYIPHEYQDSDSDCGD